jgi:YVTN family beta-propeller protein
LAAVLPGCRPKRGSGFPGYAFVANQEGRTVAAVDLTAFSLVRHIQLETGPTAISADPVRKTVHVLTPDDGTVHEIDPGQLVVRRKLRVAQKAVSMRTAPDGSALWILCLEPRQLVKIRLDSFQIEMRIALPADPADFDLSPDGRSCAVSHGVQGSVSFLDLQGGKVRQNAQAGQDMGTLRFRIDGAVLLVGDRGRRIVAMLDAATGRGIADLPVAVKPENFCFKSDGGEMFVTGEGMDALVIVNPYYNEVTETLLAGRGPGAMAVSSSPEYLFVANPPSGNVTLFNIDTRRAIAVVSVGQEPGFITFTPDGQYALVLNRRSGNLAVIRMGAIVPSRNRFAPLFTTVPVGSKPVCAAVLAV